MKKFNRVLALLLVFAMLAAAGCGGKGKTEEGQAGTGTETGSGAEGGAKDTLTIAQGADPVSLDPYGTTDTPACRVLGDRRRHHLCVPFKTRGEIPQRRGAEGKRRGVFLL